LDFVNQRQDKILNGSYYSYTMVLRIEWLQPISIPGGSGAGVTIFVYIRPLELNHWILKAIRFSVQGDIGGSILGWLPSDSLNPMELFSGSRGLGAEAPGL
jgi:hypothetical protein